MARDPSRLKVFHRAHELAVAIYRLTERLPRSERFGLSSQLRRAATSVPTNIVEGSVRHSAADYGRFLDIALGSAAEVRYLLRLAEDLHLLTAEELADCRDCSDWVVRELQNLHKAVARFPSSKP
jgi:four helix bundle protein